METLALEEGSCIDDLLPFTSTRSVLDIRMGILTLREKWARLLEPTGITPEPIQDRSASTSPATALLTISDRAAALPGKGFPLPANLLPTRELAALLHQERSKGPLTAAAAHRIIAGARIIRYPWDIFRYNDEALTEDFAVLTAGRLSQRVPPSVQTICPENIFIEEGARLQHCLLNASTGPIYIGRDAGIMEGALIRGPFACCDGAIVKMGAKIYGATTLGPHCTAGGEIKNSVFFGYSNKGHDGYLGDAVIGEWCNLGAGATASNLKNNAGDISVYHPASKTALPAGLKCGLLMGDYSRAAINTSFHTGTVTGVCCNIFGQGLPPKYIPDFSWGQDGLTRYQWDKVLRDIGNWKKLKNQSLTDAEILTLKHIFEQL